MKKIAKRFTSILSILLFIIILLTNLVSCFDLGMFQDDDKNDYEDYYSAFDEVEAFYKDGSHSYNLRKSLLNEYTIKELDWENKDDAVDKERYTYLALPVNKDMKLENVAFYINADVTTELTIYIYKLSSMSDVPSSTCYYDDDLPKDSSDDTYDDLKLENAIQKINMNVVANTWKSLNITLKNVNGASLKDGDVIVLYIYNNTGYGKRDGKLACSFSFINLLIRAVE